MKRGVEGVVEMRKGLSRFLLSSACLLVIGMAANPVVNAQTVQQDSQQMSNMPGMTPEEHQQMQNMPAMSKEQHEQMGNKEMEGHEHSHGGIETPPNGTVLGTFALINALFILIGIWNKYLRRKVA
jgi:uncharacterized protein involved in copper resistance